MDYKEKQTIQKFAACVKAYFPGARVWAFGSRVKGNAEPGSDLDVCVVIPQVTPRTRRTISDMAWEVGFNNDILVSTIVLPDSEFSENSADPLVKTILNEGVAA